MKRKFKKGQRVFIDGKAHKILGFLKYGSRKWGRLVRTSSYLLRLDRKGGAPFLQAAHTVEDFGTTKEGELRCARCGRPVKRKHALPEGRFACGISCKASYLSSLAWKQKYAENEARQDAHEKAIRALEKKTGVKAWSKRGGYCDHRRLQTALKLVKAGFRQVPGGASAGSPDGSWISGEDIYQDRQGNRAVFHEHIGQTRYDNSYSFDLIPKKEGK